MAKSLLAGLALALMLVACASPSLKLYDGAGRAASEVAVISLPEQLEVARVNDAEVKGASGMWNKGDKRLEVIPGRYELLVYYRELWELGSQHDVLRSNPARFVVDASAGAQYRIEFQRPKTYDEARRLSTAFSGWVERLGSSERLPSQASGLKFRDDLGASLGGRNELVAVPPDGSAGTQAVAPKPLPAEAAATVAGAPAVQPQARTEWLPLMQGWWREASADERRAFLQWLGTQPQ